MVMILLCRCRRRSDPERERTEHTMKRWLIRNIWLIPPMLLAAALAAWTLISNNGMRSVDHQIVLIGMAVPLGLSAVMTNLAHGKAGRRFALLGMLLAILSCYIMVKLPTSLNGYSLRYYLLTDYMLGGMPVIVPAMGIAALMVLISGCIALFSRNQLPVAKLTQGKRVLRTLPLLISGTAIALGWYALISEYRALSDHIAFYQLWAFPVMAPVLAAILFIDAAHYRGSKGAAVWGIICALAHCFAGLILVAYAYYVVNPIMEDMSWFLAFLSAVAALAEIICAVMALAMKRPPVKTRKTEQPAPQENTGDAFRAMQPNVTEPRRQLAEQPPRHADTEAMDELDLLTEPEPMEQSADKAPASGTDARTPDRATRLARLEMLRAEGMLDPETYAAAVDRVNAEYGFRS